jgi:WhiB family redox-sensing transcriptional regulator
MAGHPVALVVRRARGLAQPTPCRQADPRLWFSELPADLEVAKRLCRGCPLRAPCLAGAIERAEPWGVWGGQIIERGLVVAHKRRRGRPRRTSATGPVLRRSGATVRS